MACLLQCWASKSLRSLTSAQIPALTAMHSADEAGWTASASVWLIMTVPHTWTRRTADPEQLTARKTEHVVAHATSMRGLRASFQSHVLESCDRAASQLLSSSENLRIAAARAPVRLRDASPA